MCCVRLERRRWGCGVRLQTRLAGAAHALSSDPQPQLALPPSHVAPACDARFVGPGCLSNKHNRHFAAAVGEWCCQKQI